MVTARINDRFGAPLVARVLNREGRCSARVRTRAGRVGLPSSTVRRMMKRSCGGNLSSHRALRV
jgi:hypothetical protein